MIHYSHYGFKWGVNCEEKCFIPPFLIASNIKMKLIYTGKIHILPTEEFKKVQTKYTEVTDMNISDICTENFYFTGCDKPIGKLFYKEQ